MSRRRDDLRIVCTGLNLVAHVMVELACIRVESVPPLEAIGDDPADDEQGVDLPPMLPTLRQGRTRPAADPGRPSVHILGDTLTQTSRSQSGKSGRSRRFREYRRTPVEALTRADGGTTLVIPPCPRCKGRPALLRDDTLREYAEKTRGTQMEGTLNIAHIHMV